MKFNSVNRIGVFFVACGVLCGIIAYERYQVKRVTAEELAAALGIELLSVTIPVESWVAGFCAVALAVAGASCFFKRL